MPFYGGVYLNATRLLYRQGQAGVFNDGPETACLASVKPFKGFTFVPSRYVCIPKGTKAGEGSRQL